MDEFMNDSIQPTRTGRRRAAIACLRCRGRRVRCDLVLHGTPCTNCSLDEEECTVGTNRRRRRSRTTIERTLQSSNDMTFLSELSSGLQSRASHQNYLRDETLRNPAMPAHDAKIDLGNSNGHLEPVSGLRKGFKSIMEWPSFIKPPPFGFTADDTARLEMKGALSSPPPHVRYQILQSYLDYVHPFTPILDMEDLLAMNGQVVGTKVSALLFQAVLFGGSLYVEERYLEDAGYSSRKKARQELHLKARLLYESDYEQDKFCMARALLLMSFWYESPEDYRNCWYWSGLAIGLTQAIHLDGSAGPGKLDRHERGKWRRLIWSCFLRDRLIAVGLKLPTRLNIDDYQIEMIQLDEYDFSLAPICTDQVVVQDHLLWDTEKQRQLAAIFVENARLSMCMDYLIRVQRTEAVDIESKIQELQNCEEEYQSWFSNLPPIASFDAQYETSSDTTLKIYQALLRLTYCCINAFLQRIYLTHPSSSPDLESPTSPVLQHQAAARSKIRAATLAAAEVAQYLRRNDLVRYLPHSGVIAFVHVNLVYALEVMSIDNMDGLFQSMRAMEIFRDSYFDTAYATRFVNAAFERERVRWGSVPVSDDRDGGKGPDTSKLGRASTSPSLSESTAPAPPNDPFGIAPSDLRTEPSRQSFTSSLPSSSSSSPSSQPKQPKPTGRKLLPKPRSPADDLDSVEMDPRPIFDHSYQHQSTNDQFEISAWSGSLPMYVEYDSLVAQWRDE